MKLNRLPDSAVELQKALSMARRISDRTGEAQSLAGMARWNAASGLTPAGEQNIREAVRLIENTRLELHGRDLRTSFFARERDFYDLAIDLALAVGGSGPESALVWSERSRARSLLDMAQRSAINVTSAASIQKQLLSPGTALVEYSVSQERAIAFVVTQTEVRAVRLSIPLFTPGIHTSEEHARIASAVWWPLAIPPGIRSVAIAAEGSLARIPFAALPVSPGGEYLIKKYELSAISSASLILARRTQRVQPRSIAVFADPVFSPADPRIPAEYRSKPAAGDLASLRFTREEAKELARLGGSDTTEWSGFQATADALRFAAAQPGSILHIGTQAIVETSDPLATKLILSRYDRMGQAQAGELRLADIFGLTLKRDLVVLAGCRTGDGTDVRGEGLSSLSRAFLYAGALGLIGTLWDVDDKMASHLICSFYRPVLEDGLTPAAALRAAQIAMLRQENVGKYDWAAFVYPGDWQLTIRTHAG